MTCPKSVKVFDILTTVSPVTHVAEAAVNKALIILRSMPGFLDWGSSNKSVPMPMIITKLKTTICMGFRPSLAIALKRFSLTTVG